MKDKQQSKNFWNELKKPFFVLAPMADVTDFAFRQMFVKYGKPDVLYTEFVSADGLANEEGRNVLLRDLRFDKNEHPIVAQIFGANPENIKKAARLVAELGYDGVDINMGCPDKSIIKQGAGSGLIKNSKLAREIIQAAKEGAVFAGRRIPVSIKTRIGFNKNEIKTWIPQVLAEKPDCLIIHGRTRKELSAVDADWEAIGKVAQMGREAGVVVIGNGDVKSIEDGLEKAEKFHVDGIMVGRGVFGKPWFFDKNRKEILLKDKLEIMLEHTKLFEKEMMGVRLVKSSINIQGVAAPQFNGVKNFNILKKHYKAYVSGFDGAKELRVKLMEAKNADEIEKITREYISENL